MEKSKLYTKGGDKGETSLVSGTRLPKSSDRISLYGEVDELNSALGVVIAHLKEANSTFTEIELHILEIQSNLFNLGSRLACEPEKWTKYKLPQVDSQLLEKMEVLIDKLDHELPKLNNFILPGGSKASSFIHIARTTCRRVERSLVHFSKESIIPDDSLKLINRLSDFLFVSARYVNNKLGVDDIDWNS